MCFNVLFQTTVSKVQSRRNEELKLLGFHNTTLVTVDGKKAATAAVVMGKDGVNVHFYNFIDLHFIQNKTRILYYTHISNFFHMIIYIVLDCV